MLNLHDPLNPRIKTALYGRSTVGICKRTYGEPGRPHSPSNVQEDFDAVKHLTSVGYLDDRPVYACMVEAAQIDVMKYMSGNLFALLGRTS